MNIFTSSLFAPFLLCTSIAASQLPEKFWKACQDGDLKTLKPFIEDPSTDLNSMNIEGFTPLGLACLNNRKKLIETLVMDDRVDIEMGNREGASPLSIVCAEGHLKLIPLLIGQNADINKRDNEGRTPFFMACAFLRIGTVKLLLENIKIEPNLKNNMGITAADLVYERMRDGSDNPFAATQWKEYDKIWDLLMLHGCNFELHRSDSANKPSSPYDSISTKGCCVIL